VCVLNGPWPCSRHDFSSYLTVFHSVSCYSGLGLRHGGLFNLQFYIIRSMPLKKCTWVYLEDFGGLPLFRMEPLTFIFMFLWTVLSVEFIYIWRVIFNSLFMLGSQSQTLFFIDVSFHFLNNMSLKTSPRYHYTVVDLIWTPLLFCHC
jgi:hypothetical protein